MFTSWLELANNTSLGGTVLDVNVPCDSELPLKDKTSTVGLVRGFSQLCRWRRDFPHRLVKFPDKLRRFAGWVRPLATCPCCRTYLFVWKTSTKRNLKPYPESKPRKRDARVSYSHHLQRHRIIEKNHHSNVARCPMWVTLNPVHTGNNVKATGKQQSCQLLQQCRTSFALKFRPFDKVECCFDKVKCCFDIVAGVDRALVGAGRSIKVGKKDAACPV